MARPKNIDYSQVDWSQSNVQIAENLGVDKTTVFKKRKRLGIPPAFKPGHCPPEKRFKEFYKLSPKHKPIRDLDHEFYCWSRPDGRRKANQSYRRAVQDVYGPACKLCGYHKPLVSNHSHHVVPLSKGGKNTIRNGTVLCSRCHDEVHAGLLSVSS